LISEPGLTLWDEAVFNFVQKSSIMNQPFSFKISHLESYTQAEMVFGYYYSYPKTLTLTLSQREREWLRPLP